MTGCLNRVLLPPDEFERLPSRWSFSFAAAQSLPQLPESHPCHHLHGHTYQVEVAAEDLGTLPPLIEELHGRLHDTLVERHPRFGTGPPASACARGCGGSWRNAAQRPHWWRCRKRPTTAACILENRSSPHGENTHTARTVQGAGTNPSPSRAPRRLTPAVWNALPMTMRAHRTATPWKSSQPPMSSPRCAPFRACPILRGSPSATCPGGLCLELRSLKYLPAVLP